MPLKRIEGKILGKSVEKFEKQSAIFELVLASTLCPVALGATIILKIDDLHTKISLILTTVIFFFVAIIAGTLVTGLCKNKLKLLRVWMTVSLIWTTIVIIILASLATFAFINHKILDGIMPFIFAGVTGVLHYFHRRIVYTIICNMKEKEAVQLQIQ